MRLINQIILAIKFVGNIQEVTIRTMAFIEEASLESAGQSHSSVFLCLYTTIAMCNSYSLIYLHTVTEQCYTLAHQTLTAFDSQYDERLSAPAAHINGKDSRLQTVQN